MTKMPTQGVQRFALVQLAGDAGALGGVGAVPLEPLVEDLAHERVERDLALDLAAP